MLNRLSRKAWLGAALLGVAVNAYADDSLDPNQGKAPESTPVQVWTVIKDAAGNDQVGVRGTLCLDAYGWAETDAPVTACVPDVTSNEWGQVQMTMAMPLPAWRTIGLLKARFVPASGGSASVDVDFWRKSVQEEMMTRWAYIVNVHVTVGGR